MKNLCNGLYLNLFTADELKTELESRLGDQLVAVGNHEQYFHKDYFAYQPEYTQKIYMLGEMMSEAGFEPIFIEDVVELGGK